MKLTLSQAAELSGHNKSKIHRAIKSSALSAFQPAPGEQYEIDRSEFERIFPAKDWPSLNPVQERPFTPRSGGGSEIPFGQRSAVLALKLDMTETRLAEIQEALVRERERADRVEAERQRLLEAPRTEVEQERAERERERLEAQQRDLERRDEVERLRNDLERARVEQDRLVREVEELRQTMFKPRGLWSRVAGR